MADPTKYTRGYDYSGYQAVTPNTPLPGDQVDNDLSNIETAVNGAVDAIKDVRRSDGKLQDGSVTSDALSPEVDAYLVGLTEAQAARVEDYGPSIEFFAQVYQGPRDTAPTTRADGTALQAGDFYYDTVAEDYIAYDGLSWRLQFSYVSMWQGDWAAATDYTLSDLVGYDGGTYVCVATHTSGDWATDLGAGKWQVFAAKGASGPGSGDILGANNLSDLANANTALSNLGGTTVGRSIFKAANAAAAMTAQGISSFGQTLITAASKAAQRTALGLGSSATLDASSNTDMAVDTGAVPTRAAVAGAITTAALGVSQTWQDVKSSRALGTSYQNATGTVIAVAISAVPVSTGSAFQVSTDGVTWVAVGWSVYDATSGGATNSVVSAGPFVVPSGHYYRFNGTGALNAWSELR